MRDRGWKGEKGERTRRQVKGPLGPHAPAPERTAGVLARFDDVSANPPHQIRRI
ncbi:hypothetical protein B0H10DRAFT_2124280 [Mycena sp. CBHHK59/15]|nr:hypothetical protein B0H10DRAFT_2124280 [Mycena sp. CBHHK59/15]